MPACVILNPYSGRYTGRKRWPAAQAALQRAGLAYELASTERPGHARELACDAALAGYSPEKWAEIMRDVQRHVQPILEAA